MIQSIIARLRDIFSRVERCDAAGCKEEATEIVGRGGWQGHYCEKHAAAAAQTLARGN